MSARRGWALAVTTAGLMALGAWRGVLAAEPVTQEPIAQQPVAPESAATAQTRAPVPWRVGEKLTYDVKFGVLRVGTGSMEVAGVADVRGREAYHTFLRVRGGTFFYKVDDRFESWVDTRTLESLRFVQDQQEGRKERERHYEIFPDRRVYTEGDGAEQPSVADPLDDGSFLFFVRTLPLRDGDTYELHRYFKPDRNPVRIKVLRRERVSVPAGTFNAIVVQPSIKTKGIFSENGRAEVWLADDSTRMMLQMRSSLSFGTLTLQLTRHENTR